jgi:hypothetical protein
MKKEKDEAIRPKATRNKKVSILIRGAGSEYKKN